MSAGGIREAMAEEAAEKRKAALSSSCSMHLLALRLRNAIADKETCVACANADLAKYGEWQCDWSEGMRIAQNEVDKQLTQIDKANDLREGSNGGN